MLSPEQHAKIGKKFQNGVREIKLKGEPINLTKSDIFFGLFDALGASVSDMPHNYKSHSETNKTELFDPEKVTEPEELPEYWLKVWKLHNEPSRKDCVTLRYRYVHVPYKILPQYPRVPCEGIFCIVSRQVKWNQIKADDLIHVGNSIDEGW